MPPRKRARTTVEDHGIASCADGADDDDSGEDRSPQRRSSGKSVTNKGTISNAAASQYVGTMNHTINHFANATEQVNKKQRLLDSLGFPTMSSRRLNVSNAEKKTCEWLFKNAKFKKWIGFDNNFTGSNFLWLKGKPGAGKSTLMKHALKHLERPAMRKRSHVISFFFNARGMDVLEKSTIGMYRSLIHQLLNKYPALQDKFLGTYGNQSWEHIDMLQNAFDSVIEDIPTQDRLFILVDALDECPVEEIRAMINRFNRLPSDAPKILFASRPYPEITFDGCPILKIDQDNGHKDDISTYIDKNLRIDPKLNSKYNFMGEIAEKASGIFLWVILVVDLLNSSYDQGDIAGMKVCLAGIPKDLDEFFKELLTRDSRSQSKSVILLQWVLFMKRPLTGLELYLAINSDESLKDAWPGSLTDDVEETILLKFLLHQSKGLVEMRRADQTVQFIHETVRAFFLNGGLEVLDHRLKDNLKGASEDRLSICCFNYLSSPHISVLDRDEKDYRDLVRSKFPWLEYAMAQLFSHAESAQELGVTSDILVRLEHFDGVHLGRWISFHNFLERYKTRHYTKEAQLLYILADQNHTNLIAKTAKGHALSTVVGGRHGLALHAACAHGNVQIIKFLLSAKADANAFVKKSDHKYPLYAAVSSGSTLAVEEVLKQCDWSLLSGVPSWHPLFKSKMEISQEILLRFSRDYKIDPNLVAKDGMTFFSTATRLDFQFLVQGLLEDGSVDPGSKDRFGQTPLLWAARKGYELVVQRFLKDSRVDPDSKDSPGRTALSLAAAEGHELVVQRLLEDSRVDPDSKNGSGRTPLSCAAAGGHELVVQRLLEDSRVDPDSKTGSGQTALSFAAAEGHELVVQRFLEDSRVHPDSKDGSGRTPLSWAAEKGHNLVVQRLLEDGRVDPESKDESRRTPLSWATHWSWNGSGHGLVVQRLLKDSRVDPESKDGSGRTPLSWAAENGQELVVQRLLKDSRVDPESKDGSGQTPLSWAAEKGHELVIQRLLGDSRVDPESKDGSGQTPLSWAAANGHDLVVQRLLEDSRVNPESKDGSGQTPLTWAAEKGHELVVQRLLGDSRVDPESKDGSGRTPLSWAAENGQELVVQRLLEDVRVNPESKDGSGRTPSSWATQRPYTCETIQGLLRQAITDRKLNDQGR